MFLYNILGYASVIVPLYVLHYYLQTTDKLQNTSKNVKKRVVPIIVLSEFRSTYLGYIAIVLFEGHHTHTLLPTKNDSNVVSQSECNVQVGDEIFLVFYI
jgi:hypothetical protein